MSGQVAVGACPLEGEAVDRAGRNRFRLSLRGNSRDFHSRQRRAGWAFAAPAILLLLLLDVLPILVELFYSLTRYNLLTRASFVGLANYSSALTSSLFWYSVLRTVYFAGVLVVVGSAMALGLAVLLNQTLVGVAVHRTIVYLPQAVSYAAGALIWTWLFNPTYGPLDRVLLDLHLAPVAWLTSSNLAMPSLILVSLWRDVGYYMLIFLAALQNVPTSLYESAHLDGAGAWRTFRTVTLPHIRPASLFVLLTWSLGALQMFTQAYVMTNGGPGRSTLSVVLDIYQEGFQNLDLGLASAESFVVFVLSLALSVFYVRAFKRAIE